MYVYILKSEKDGSSYVGSTKNLQERIISHNNGHNLSTKNKRPWVLVKTEEYNNVLLALKREKFLKSGKGRAVVKNLCSLGNLRGVAHPPQSIGGFATIAKKTGRGSVW